MKSETINKSPEVISQMFDGIATHYDKYNHLFTFGLDKHWRKKLIKELSKKKPQTILDVATGTGDLAFELSKASDSPIIAIDIAPKMIEIAQQKQKQKNDAQNIQFFAVEDGVFPFESNYFDAIMIGFGVRNFENLEKMFFNFHKILVKKGFLYILEFSYPKNIIVRAFFTLYASFLMPFLTNILSKNAKAYKYLFRSIKDFPSGKAFWKVLNDGGFIEEKEIRLMFGLVSIYIAKKI